MCVSISSKGDKSARFNFFLVSCVVSCIRSTGGHYNPDKLKHGAREDSVRHVGDLGNVAADENGSVSTSYSDNVITLFGSRSIIGRAIVLHAAEDDLGRTDHPDSHKTGNAGGRVACGIIGVL
jgi:superoxide dismutase, Cu-Zn family